VTNEFEIFVESMLQVKHGSSTTVGHLPVVIPLEGLEGMSPER